MHSKLKNQHKFKKTLLLGMVILLCVCFFVSLSLDSMKIPVGKITSIIDANRLEKSTLLKATMGDIPITSGQITIHNQPINPKLINNQRARNSAFLPQFSLLNFPFTVEEVVRLEQTPHDTGNELDTDIIHQSLAVVEMNDFSQRLYPQLSGGEKQRIQLARVFAQIWRTEDSSNPRLLLLDEPNTSLNLGHQPILMQFLQEFAKSNVAILIVLHNLNTVANDSDELIALHAGTVLTTGTPEQILTSETIESLFAINCHVTTNPKTGKPIMLEE